MYSNIYEQGYIFNINMVYFVHLVIVGKKKKDRVVYVYTMRIVVVLFFLPRSSLQFYPRDKTSERYH